MTARRSLLNALIVDPPIDVARIEAQQMAPLDERDPPLSNEPANMTIADAKSRCNARNIKKPIHRTRRTPRVSVDFDRFAGFGIHTDIYVQRVTKTRRGHSQTRRPLRDRPDQLTATSLLRKPGGFGAREMCSGGS